jgi:acyl-CoA reductase-like NAD-dependent aldehyde dehydrogenase
MLQIFIDGAWVEARTASSRDVANPATLKTLGTVPECGADDVARAVAAARAALPGWRNVPGARRAAFLVEIGGRIRARKRELATLLTQEAGKPLCESLDCIDAVVAIFEGCGAIAESGGADTGVTAAIVPFNFPLLIMASSIAPAIAAGNTVVCKAPPQNPLASLKLAEVYEALPAGVVNVITGGTEACHALIGHHDVERVTFTGSAELGRKIEAAAGGKRVELDLSSLDAFIVCKDANLDAVVPGIAWARLMNGGQGLASGRHMYVDRSIVAEFVERMHQCVGFLDVDDPIKPPTDLGPLISLEAAHRVEDQVGRSLRAGAKLILGGRRFRPSGLPGHFFQPTILTDVRPGSVPTCEEIAGPVISVTPVADAAEAIRLAGASGSQLSGASIYTNSPEAALKMLESVNTGLFRINDPATGHGAGPLGGAHRGGILRPPKQVEIARVMEQKPWWFPYLNRARG